MPGYKLPSSAEVEQHIQRTGHLPGIASASEMVEQGNDLHKTDAELLEKIEELTLYGIEQQKQIEKQQGEIDQLKRLVNQLTKQYRSSRTKLCIYKSHDR